jgi:hypothetical protein
LLLHGTHFYEPQRRCLEPPPPRTRAHVYVRLWRMYLTLIRCQQVTDTSLTLDCLSRLSIQFAQRCPPYFVYSSTRNSVCSRGRGCRENDVVVQLYDVSPRRSHAKSWVDRRKSLAGESNHQQEQLGHIDAWGPGHVQLGAENVTTLAWEAYRQQMGCFQLRELWF